MKVYSIVVTYNGMQCNWIKKCLDSLIYSSIPTNIVLVDNGSVDETVAFVRQNYPDVNLTISEKNQGFGRANNVGIREAIDNGADYVFLLNQDAWVEENTLELLVRAAADNPEYGILSPVHLNGSSTALDYDFSRYIIPEKCPNIISDVYLNQIDNKIYGIDFVNAAAWLISRKCIETVGGFNSLFYHYGEDINYLHRAKYHGYKVGLMPAATICHDRESRQKSIYKSDFYETTKRWALIYSCNPSSRGYEVYQYFILRWADSIAHPSIFRMLMLFKALAYLIFNTRSFRGNRELSKSTGTTFLK
ncbi:glycosyltransferase family 2 protein [uncultured Imperialibacter sp.]|uniref:glycosyltransferase family 2 protein n=1 Tax=uncultured Imperialibacter sp. TaxID=1672639 RepID=UPI0030DB7180|tara:strand:+ start:116057 stop:116971 length:915 start_codon:yes stop_codon:yes gene_type:complete